MVSFFCVWKEETMQKAFYLRYEKKIVADFGRAKNADADDFIRAFFPRKEDYADRTRDTAVKIQR